MNRQLELRVERRIRMWVLEQELERRKVALPSAPTPIAHSRPG
jgi:hypothetical protein